MDAGDIPGFRIERMLGRGGGGAVYEAIQLSVGRRVAIKVLRPELCDDPTFVERFQREARLQASLHHAGVVVVYEAGMSDRGPFIAMQLIDGVSLERELHDGVLTAERALNVLTQVAAALDAAHASGLVHGDVKPRNVLVEPDGTAYLADFGLTRDLGATQVTADGPMLGTPYYLAPEVIHGDPASPASDRYAFAAMAFECLTGSVPFRRGTPAAVLFAHTHDDPPKASEVRPELPPAVDDLFTAGLAKLPQERPARAGVFVDRVTSTLGAVAAALPSPGLPVDVSRSSGTTPVARSGVSRWAVVGAVLAAALAGAGVTALVVRSPSDPAPVTAAGRELLGTNGDVDAVRSVNCRGGAASLMSEPCSIRQVGLDGARMVASSSGTITAWSVRGATGDVVLQVFRAGENDEIFQAARSQPVTVPDERWHTFTADVPIERGDFIALGLGPGATVGLAGSEGTTERWFPVLRGSPGRPADAGPTRGFRGALMVNAQVKPGGEVVQPRQLLGGAAERAPDGRVIKRGRIEFTSGGRLDVRLVEESRRVWLDAFDGDRRLARVEVPGAASGGMVVSFEPVNYAWEDAYGEVALSYVNPESGRVLERYYGVSASGFDFYG